MFDFVCGYICGMVITFWRLCSLWVQPYSTNPYMKGDKVKFNGKTYESLIDNNVWSPAGYPAGWKGVEE